MQKKEKDLLEDRERRKVYRAMINVYIERGIYSLSSFRSFFIFKWRSNSLIKASISFFVIGFWAFFVPSTHVTPPIPCVALIIIQGNKEGYTFRQKQNIGVFKDFFLLLTKDFLPVDKKYRKDGQKNNLLIKKQVLVFIDLQDE